MFVRRLGKQCLLLASYRDGRGKVCQRRLASFRDRASLEEHLHRLVPTAALERLRSRALALLEEIRPARKPPQERVRDGARTVLNVLAQQPELEALEEVQVLHRRLRGEPVISRRRYWAQDPEVVAWAEALEREALELEQRGRLEESLAVYLRRLSRVQGDRTPLRAARLLQRLGRREQALEVVAAMPPGDAWREYHLATLCWQLGRWEQAMGHFYRALKAEPKLSPSYWREYADMWDEPGRRVLSDLMRLPVIRTVLRAGGRTQVPRVARGWLLDRALRIASGVDPGRSLGRLDWG
jgi:tetratricopeptide (TPR) repeat protein